MKPDPNFKLMRTFVRRLDAIGIQIKLSANYPWIYLISVNGIYVDERYMGEHGFTAFWFPVRLGNKTEFTNRRKVFAKVRECCESL